MRSLRRTIELKDGVKVQTLFTPHLFSFKGQKGITFEAPDPSSPTAIFETYADVLYAAALNVWVLDDGGQIEDFPYTRGDFHEYMTLNPKAFAADVNFAVEALTGKTLKELAQKKEAENEPAAEPGKKKVSLSIGRLLRRSS